MIDRQSTLRLAHTLADLTKAKVSPYSVTVEALRACPLSLALPKSAHEIACSLHALAAKAYQAQHNVTVEPWPALPLFPSLEEQSIYQQTNGTRPAPWQFALCSMLDYWCAVTEHPCTASEPLRKTLQAFSTALALSIVRHAAAYELYT